MTEQKDKALGMAISQIEKNFGRGAIMKLGDTAKQPVEVIPTGSISLDYALGVGGLPQGRIVEIFGPEMGGKTTISLHVVAEAQKRGGIAAFVDAEHALDPVFAKKIGVDINNLLLSQPDYGEQALEIVDTLVRSGAVDIIVVDSVAALVPKAEVEGEMGDTIVGAQARLMSHALRKLTAIVNKSKTIVIFVNQLREKVGVMWGNPEITPGGRALKFYSSVRLEVRSMEKIKDGDRIIGSRTRIKVVKNKVAAPFGSAEVDLIYGEGIDRVGDLLTLGASLDVVKKSGSWYMYENTKLGQGLSGAVEFLKAHADIKSKIEKGIRELLKKGVLKNIPPAKVYKK